MILSCRPNARAILVSRKSTFAELFKRADFVTLHTPLTDKNHDIVDDAAIASMR